MTTVRFWVHFGLTILKKYMFQFPPQGGTWHHRLMLKVTSCGRKCANKPKSGSAHDRRHIMTSPGHTGISRRDIQTSAPCVIGLCPFSISCCLPPGGGNSRRGQLGLNTVPDKMCLIENISSVDSRNWNWIKSRPHRNPYNFPLRHQAICINTSSNNFLIK